MLRSIILAIGLCSAMAITASAADPAQKKQRTPLTEEQKATKKELMEKYDKNKDGKLSKEEKDAMSAEDKAKLEKIQPPAKKKKQ
jgi:hypothetical protein